MKKTQHLYLLLLAAWEHSASALLRYYRAVGVIAFALLVFVGGDL